ncbi:MAG: hypothetical protein D6712_21480 [Chloroflexi bacterium]|nr:MAG: hypothetical protein D6712_21480 [Chloroflexota bacterium]
MASYNRYSHHARRALTHAAQLTTRFRHSHVDTAHLLVGVMLAQGSIGYEILYALNLVAARAEPHLATLAPQTAAAEFVDHSPTLDDALALAEDESARLGCHYVGTEHFLLGITRTNVGNAAALLRLLDSSPEEVRQRVRRTIKAGVVEFNLQAAKNNARFSELSRRVITAAEQMAVAMDHEMVSIGHLLLILLRERRSPISALLRNNGLHELALKQALEQKDNAAMTSIVQVLEKAIDQAGRLGSHYTGTEHLLLTLCADADGNALLIRMGLKPEALRQQIEAMTRDS